MENSFFSQPLNRVVGGIALAMAVIALGMYSYYTWKQSEYMYSGPTTISVMGEGEINAVPDIGEFSFSVQAKGADAATAQADSAAKMEAIVSYLKGAGVEEKDIKTENYNLYPKYRYEDRPCGNGMYCPSGEPIEDGFEVSQTVRVKVRAIDTAGKLIAEVGGRGATNLSGLAFTIDDTSALKEEARTQAIADAKAKAQVLADQLGVELVKMVGYYEDQVGAPVPYYGMGGDQMMAKAESYDAAVLPTGENTTMSRVTITYQVR
jgi:uncharacterized protein